MPRCNANVAVLLFLTPALFLFLFRYTLHLQISADRQALAPSRGASEPPNMHPDLSPSHTPDDSDAEPQPVGDKPIEKQPGPESKQPEAGQAKPEEKKDEEGQGEVRRGGKVREERRERKGKRLNQSESGPKSRW